jgi:hypothetical protein
LARHFPTKKTKSKSSYLVVVDLFGPAFEREKMLLSATSVRACSAAARSYLLMESYVYMLPFLFFGAHSADCVAEQLAVSD